ncbi:hypothetical protein MmTuc01_0675 [Methanosarcina mazei Tuc01]|uniref:Uncharacterized protein n=1 Tax=Methanosarcina mazei Tuc01 TaxID=1236903 RepID=M1Q7E4_METMZ|nr:hypothetical protein MmTuc01_0675 [Methanosarcina mazei Tuc01]
MRNMGIKKNIIIGRTVLVLLGLALITFCSGCVEKKFRE